MNEELETLDSFLSESVERLSDLVGSDDISYDDEDKGQQVIDLIEEIRGVINA